MRQNFTPSTTRLADLKAIDNDPKRFQAFFDWKTNRRVSSGFRRVNAHSWKNMPCVLCEMYVRNEVK